ncbi:MAG: alpha/beta hydrolase [Spirochaetia bacterium]|nr:alpha/beta hydrolase [Spirochaetia bacterium]
MRKLQIVPILLILFTSNCATWLLNRAIGFERGRADLEEKMVPVGKFHFVYTEGGNGETILMVHGFAGEKDHWTRMSAYLTDKYHVIAPDLPGHGLNDKLPEENYSIISQATRLHDFMQNFKVKKYHLVGSSMGGAISAYYASAYPDEILTLTLIDAAGVKSPTKSEMELEVAKGNNPLLVNTVEDFDRMMAFTTVKPPYLPGIIKGHFAEKAVRNRPFNEKIFEDIRGEKGRIESRLSLIQARTLIIWGDTDRVIDPSAASVFQAKIKNAKTVIMKACGHGPMIERPEETSQHFLKFLQN